MKPPAKLPNSTPISMRAKSGCTACTARPIKNATANVPGPPPKSRLKDAEVTAEASSSVRCGAPGARATCSSARPASCAVIPPCSTRREMSFVRSMRVMFVPRRLMRRMRVLPSASTKISVGSAATLTPVRQKPVAIRRAVSSTR